MTVFDGRMAARLQQQRPLLGIFSAIPSPALIEMAGYAGFDFVVIDNEHGPAGIETTENLIRAARGADIPAIVRVSGANQQEILRTLDAGASGVQVPQVNTVEQARLVVSAAKYPPRGSRGVAFGMRAAGYGFFGGAAYVEAANNQTVVITHIETVEAVDNLNAMLEIAGLDVVFIGPTDLSVSMGHPGDPSHPVVQATIADCIRRIAASGRVPGLMLSSVEQVPTYANLGARYLTVNMGNVVGGALKAVVAGADAARNA
jgi:4-hydroxy-2-oxoheptanedioate aldolase